MVLLPALVNPETRNEPAPLIKFTEAIAELTTLAPETEYVKA